MRNAGNSPLLVSKEFLLFAVKCLKKDKKLS